MPQIGTYVARKHKDELWEVIGTFPKKLYLQDPNNHKRVKNVSRFQFKKKWRVVQNSSSKAEGFKRLKQRLEIDALKKNMGYPAEYPWSTEKVENSNVN